MYYEPMANFEIVVFPIEMAQGKSKFTVQLSLASFDKRNRVLILSEKSQFKQLFICERAFVLKVVKSNMT